MKLNRRAFMGAGTALAASLYLPGIVRANTDDSVTVGYDVLKRSDLEKPFGFQWTKPANLVGMQGLEPLVRLGGENTIDYVLAKRIEADADALTWTIELQPNIRWLKRGDLLTAAHVKDSMERWMAEESSGPGEILRKEMDNIELVDDLTLRLHLKTPDYHLLYALTHYAAFIMHPADAGSFGDGADTTGPYTASEYRDGDVAMLQPNYGYWQTAKVARMAVLVTPENNPEVRYGFIPSLSASVSPADLPARLKGDGLSVKINSNAATFVLHMRCDGDGPFAHAETRKALRLAVDPQAMSNALNNYGHPADHTHMSPINHDYPTGWRPKVTYNPEAARALLKGRPLTAKVHYPADNLWQAAVAKSVARQAAAVGVTLIPTSVEPGFFNANWDKFADITIIKWVHRPLGMMAWDLVYRSTAKWNLSKWKNDRFDSLLDAMASTPLHDKAKLDKLTLEAMAIQEEDGPMLQVWVDCTKAYDRNLLVPESVQVGSGDYLYPERLRRAA